ncbi:DsbA family oxidoreductase [Arthrobacter sp. AOP36-A1-22]|uniref:DsbA family oxidoreductase n=1 Tax=unclassified Arthrobacter TaxID=235627 RepID=UPI004033C1CA
MTSPRLSVDIWSDISCPWCFIGKRRFEAALATLSFRDQVDVTWHSYQLDPSLPAHYDGTEFEYLSQKKGMDPAQVKQMLEHVTGQAADEGLHYDFGNLKVANSFTAHRLLHLAGAHGLAGEVKEALLSAQFEKGLDTGDTTVLRRIGTDAGLAEDDVVAVLESDRYTAEVEADIAQARALGVTGVPFFVLDMKYGISGAQPPEVFAEALTTAWGEVSPLSMVNAGQDPASGTQAPACGPEGCD